MLKEHNKPAKMQLTEINKLLQFEKGRLQAIKEEIRRIYNTNKLIINFFLEARGRGNKEMTELEKKYQNTYSDLLTGGGTGWMFEYMVYLHQRKKGYVALLTFGTVFDPAGVDGLYFDVPLDYKIKFGLIKKPRRLKS